MPSAMMIREGIEYVPGYRTVKFLGEGNYGEVWMASAPGGAFAALKFINMRGSNGAKEFRGIQRVKTINHGNLMPITALWMLDENGDALSDKEFESFEPDEPDITDTLRPDPKKGRLLVVAMLLAEKDLHQRACECREDDLEGLERIPANELLGYMRQAAEGIDHLNSQKRDLGDGPVSIQHCDVKPANMLLRGGVVNICDFGLAYAMRDMRLTATSVLGTPPYISPECISQKPSNASDQYSLACSYHELRTGSWPFDCGSSLVEVLATHSKGKLDLSLLPERERKVIARATSVNPDRRFPSCAALVQALEEALEPPKRPGWFEESLKLMGQVFSYTPHVLGALCVLAIVIASAYVIKGMIDRQPPSLSSEQQIEPLWKNKLFADAYQIASQAGRSDLREQTITKCLAAVESDRAANKFEDILEYVYPLHDLAKDASLIAAYDESVEAWTQDVDKPDGDPRMIIPELHDVWSAAEQASPSVRDQILTRRDTRLRDLIENAHALLPDTGTDVGPAKNEFAWLNEHLVKKMPDDRRPCWKAICDLGLARADARECLGQQANESCETILERTRSLQESLDKIEDAGFKDRQQTLLLTLLAMLEHRRHCADDAITPILRPLADRIRIDGFREHLGHYSYENQASERLKNWLLAEAQEHWGEKPPEERADDPEFVECDRFFSGLLTLHFKCLDARRLVNRASPGTDNLDEARRLGKDILKALSEEEMEAPIDPAVLHNLEDEVKLTLVDSVVHEAHQRLAGDDMVRARELLTTSRDGLKQIDLKTPGYSETAFLVRLHDVWSNILDPNDSVSEIMEELDQVIDATPDVWLWGTNRDMAETLSTKLLPAALLERLENDVIGIRSASPLKFHAVRLILQRLTAGTPDQDAVLNRLTKIEIVDTLCSDAIDFRDLREKCERVGAAGDTKHTTDLDALVRLCWFECQLEADGGRFSLDPREDLASLRAQLEPSLPGNSRLQPYARYVEAVVLAEQVGAAGQVAEGVLTLVPPVPGEPCPEILQLPARTGRVASVFLRAVQSSYDQSNTQGGSLVENPFIGATKADRALSYLAAHQVLTEQPNLQRVNPLPTTLAFRALSAYFADAQDLDDAIANADAYLQLVADPSKDVDQSVLYQRVLVVAGKARAERYSQSEDNADRNAAIIAFARFIEEHVGRYNELDRRIQLTRRSQYTEALQRSLSYFSFGDVPPTIEPRKPTKSIQAIDDDVRAALATLYYHKSMILQRDFFAVHPTPTPEERADLPTEIYRNLGIASMLSPDNPNCIVELAYAYRQLPAKEDSATATREYITQLLIPLRNANPPIRNAGFHALDGWLCHMSARVSHNLGEKLKLFEQAITSYENANMQMGLSRGAYVDRAAFFLVDQSSACVELAVLSSEQRKAELLEKAADVARIVVDSRDYADRPVPENAWIAWGNALEDRALYLGELRCYADAEKKFRRALEEAEAGQGRVAIASFNLGRCMQRRIRDTRLGDLRTEQERVDCISDALEKLRSSRVEAASAIHRAQCWFFEGEILREVDKLRLIAPEASLADLHDSKERLAAARDAFWQARDVPQSAAYASLWVTASYRWADASRELGESDWASAFDEIVTRVTNSPDTIGPNELVRAVQEFPMPNLTEDPLATDAHVKLFDKFSTDILDSLKADHWEKTECDQAKIHIHRCDVWLLLYTSADWKLRDDWIRDRDNAEILAAKCPEAIATNLIAQLEVNRATVCFWDYGWEKTDGPRKLSKGLEALERFHHAIQLYDPNDENPNKSWLLRHYYGSLALDIVTVPRHLATTLEGYSQIKKKYRDAALEVLLPIDEKHVTPLQGNLSFKDIVELRKSLLDVKVD